MPVQDRFDIICLRNNNKRIFNLCLQNKKQNLDHGNHLLQLI